MNSTLLSSRWRTLFLAMCRYSSLSSTPITRHWGRSRAILQVRIPVPLACSRIRSAVFGIFLRILRFHQAPALTRGQYDHSSRHFPKKTATLILQDVRSWDNCLLLRLKLIRLRPIHRPSLSGIGNLRRSAIERVRRKVKVRSEVFWRRVWALNTSPSYRVIASPLGRGRSGSSDQTHYYFVGVPSKQTEMIGRRLGT